MTVLLLVLLWFRTMDSQLLPAWVQAIGSILAIFAAALFVWWQHKLQTEREEKKSRERIRGQLDVLRSEIEFCSLRAKEYLALGKETVEWRLPLLAHEHVLPLLMQEGVLIKGSLACIYHFYEEVYRANSLLSKIQTLIGTGMSQKIQETVRSAKETALLLVPHDARVRSLFHDLSGGNHYDPAIEVIEKAVKALDS